MNSIFSGVGAIFAALAVMLGAFGAHGLKSRLTESMLNAFQTGVEYQMYHALALLIVGFAIHLNPDNLLLKWSGALFIIGIILFSGSLYILSLTGLKYLGMVTPFGGLAFIAGWIVFAYSLLS